MNTNRTLSGMVEIDLIQIMKDMLCMWRPLLAMMLIAGLATTGVMYKKDLNTYNETVASHENLKNMLAQAEAMSAAADEEDAESTQVYSDLTEAEKLALESAILQEKNVQHLEEYAEKSLYMGLDADKIDKLTIDFTVSGSSEYTGTVATVLADCAEDDVFLNTVADAMNKSLKKETTGSYVAELVNAVPAGNTNGLSSNIVSYIKVEILLPKDVSASDVTEAVKSYMMSKSNELKNSVGNHQVKYVDSNQSVISSKEIFDAQNANATAIVNGRTTVNTATASFSELQQQIFTAKMNAEVEEVEEVYNLDTDGDGVADAMDRDGNGIDDATEIDAEVPHPTPSLKYFLLGLLIGLVLFGGLYLLLIILVPIIQTGNELSDVFGIKSFGNLHSQLKRMGFFRDKNVHELLYHKNKSRDELLSDAAERIAVYAKYNELSEISLVSSDAESTGVINMLIDSLTQKGISAKHLDLFDGEKISDLAEESLSNDDNYVICMMPHATKVSDVDKILSIASDYKKNLVGSLAI